MELQQAEQLLMTYSQKFPPEFYSSIKEKLLEVEYQPAMLALGQMKDPLVMLLISIFGGGLGIDRFLIGDTGLGIGKLITCGGCGIWALIDCFLIMDATRQKNVQKFYMLLGVNMHF